jgi:hypothetical protein
MIDHSLIEKSAENATIGGGLTAIMGGLTSTDIAAFGGLLVALIGLLINIYYKHQDNKREQELHEARLRQFRIDDDTL